MSSRTLQIINLCKTNNGHRDDDSTVVPVAENAKSNIEEPNTSNITAAHEELCNSSSNDTPNQSRIQQHIVELSTQNSQLDSDEESQEEPFSPDHSDYNPEADSSSRSSSSDIRVNATNGNIAEIPQPSNNAVRLDGMETFPETTNKPRKRVRHQSEWARNIQKEKRAKGESYVSSRKKTIPAVTLKPPCHNCRNKCHLKISEDERKDIFKSYYALADYSRERDFIHSNTNKFPKKRLTADNNSKRNNSITFFLPSNGERIKVCKTMFLNTLGIKKGVVDIAMKKRTSKNTCEGDKRGKHVKKVTHPVIVTNVKEHIGSFPVVPSHYCRATTKRQYLDPSLNINLMYKLYCQFCDQRGEPKAKLRFYGKIFNENFNLAFHKPKKDQCRVCVHYTNASLQEKNNLKDKYKEHLDLKDKARSEKIKDKKEAEASQGKFVCANFDLQQVLLVPSDPTNNALFYKRRLATYNFTIYVLNKNEGYCYMWDQTEGGRGSCEIASSIHLFLKSLPPMVNRITFYSDRCGGQNLNQFMATMFMIAVQELENISIIDMKFLVPGHTQMECDSIYSAISTELRRVGKASWPEDLKQIARSARRKGDKPYQVRNLSREDIQDYKLFMKENLTNRKKDDNSADVYWQKMCWMRFERCKPFQMQFKQEFDESFRTLNFKKRNLRQALAQLKRLYTSPIPIPTLKYRDLVSLFTMNPPALGKHYEQFYLGLPHNEDATEEIDDGDFE